MMLRSLRIRLGLSDVGSLFALDDGRIYFRFDDVYAIQQDRPVLSQLYLAETPAATQAQLLDPALAANRGDGHGGLPAFFQNLLPEGQLRRHLTERAGLLPDDEFGLLAYCGLDLPGDVQAVSEQLEASQIGRLLGQSRDSYEMSSAQMPVPEGESVSGVQPKLALVREPGGRYVMRSKTSAGEHFIGKLPASDYPHLPEVEYASLKLAAAAGVETCECELLKLSAIADQLPFAMNSDAEYFLLVKRFDRDADTPTRRRHMEDFAQVTGTPAANKYAGTYAAIGYVLKQRSERGADDVLQLLRRIKVNELLGNFDAHLKNFSLLYRTPQRAALSPAYDIVAYSAYLGGRGHALAFLPAQTSRTLLTPATLRRLGQQWDVPEPRMRAAVIDTVDAAMRLWPAMLQDLPLQPEQRVRMLAHLEANPAAQAWLGRQRRRG